MQRKVLGLVLVVLVIGWPHSAHAQCSDQHCRNLQYMLYAAQTDFREFRGPRVPSPDATVGKAKVPCQLSTWSNNVPMYMCYGEVSPTEADEWYSKTLTTLQRLQYLWHFKVENSGSDHYVDAGPTECEAAAPDGPYQGQCPLHLQAVKQTTGTSKVYLWLNSYTSPYLVPKPPDAPAKKQASPQ